MQDMHLMCRNTQFINPKSRIAEGFMRSSPDARRILYRAEIPDKQKMRLWAGAILDAQADNGRKTVLKRDIQERIDAWKLARKNCDKPDVKYGEVERDKRIGPHPSLKVKKVRRQRKGIYSSHDVNKVRLAFPKNRLTVGTQFIGQDFL